MVNEVQRYICQLVQDWEETSYHLTYLSCCSPVQEQRRCSTESSSSSSIQLLQYYLFGAPILWSSVQSRNVRFGPMQEYLVTFYRISVVRLCSSDIRSEILWLCIDFNVSFRVLIFPTEINMKNHNGNFSENSNREFCTLSSLREFLLYKVYNL